MIFKTKVLDLLRFAPKLVQIKIDYLDEKNLFEVNFINFRSHGFLV